MVEGPKGPSDKTIFVKIDAKAEALAYPIL
jgi:hypothetical protein